jgi:fructokinase
MLPVVREAMALADVVKLSVEELQLLSGLDDLAAGLATLSGPALVLVTRGRGRGGPSGWRVAGVGGAQSDATRYHWGGGRLRRRAAGGLGRTDLAADAGELPAILAQAHGCGALATTAKGAMTALPTRTRLDEFCDQAQTAVDLRLEARLDSPTLM